MLKYKISTLLTLIIMIFTFSLVKADEPKLIGKVIYIDPGHGGRDPGATYKEIKESDINLEISNKIKKELEAEGAKVYLTRNGDYDLSKINTKNHKKNDLETRAKLINESDCDIYISIHLNSDKSPSWEGLQIFYTNKNEKNKKLAEITSNEFKKDMNIKRKIKQLKNMYLFDRITKPGILIEAGFISNSNDRYKLKQNDYQEQIAQTIKKSLINYYK